MRARKLKKRVCPFCEENEIEVMVEIISRGTGKTIGLTAMCRNCHKYREKDEWFEWRKTRELEKGFTLIELAVVLVVLGILVGLGAGMLGALIKGIKYRESRDMLYRLSDSVLGKIYDTKAVPTNPFTFSPSKDAFGNDLYYVYVPITDVCSATSTTLKLCKNGTANCTGDVLYVVLAKGSNYNLQSNIPVGGTAVDGSNYDVVVYDYGTSVDSYSGDFTRTEPYDDIYDFRTLTEVKARVCPPPSTGGGNGGGSTCTSITVKNNSGAKKEIYVDPSNPTCKGWKNGKKTTLQSGDTLYVFPNGWCPFLPEASITFSNACQIDQGGNKNGQICYNGAGSFVDC